MVFGPGDRGAHNAVEQATTPKVSTLAKAVAWKITQQCLFWDAILTGIKCAHGHRVQAYAGSAFAHPHGERRGSRRLVSSVLPTIYARWQRPCHSACAYFQLRLHRRGILRRRDDASFTIAGNLSTCGSCASFAIEYHRTHQVCPTSRLLRNQTRKDCIKRLVRWPAPVGFFCEPYDAGDFT
jgi:hypothetical protein